jgi:hypothetical protein
MSSSGDSLWNDMLDLGGLDEPLNIGGIATSSIEGIESNLMEHDHMDSESLALFHFIP